MSFRKVINSTNPKYQPVSTDILEFDTVPTVNSFNAVTSDAVARAVAGASGEVPQVTENDNGKVLTAIFDEGGSAVEWAEAPDPLPAIGDSDDGKVLMASYTPAHDDVPASSEVSWASIPSQLPAYDPVADLGKVLKITEDGPAWVALT